MRGALALTVALLVDISHEGQSSSSRETVPYEVASVRPVESDTDSRRERLDQVVIDSVERPASN